MDSSPAWGGPGTQSAQGAATEAVGPYLRAVRRHWRLVLLVTIVAVAVAAYTTEKAGSSYQASASVLVSPLPEGDANWIGTGVVLDTGDPARTVQTAAALINAPQAAAETASKLGPGWTTDSVQKAINVTPLGQSNVVSVTGTASTGRAAAEVANSFALAAVSIRGQAVQTALVNELAADLKQLSGLAPTSPNYSTLNASIGEIRAARATGGDPSLRVAQAAQVPTSPSGASKKLILILALLGGFALGSVAAIALEFFAKPVRDEEEIEALFPVPVLATIPSIRRRGSGPIAPANFPAAAFEQVRMLRVQLDAMLERRVIMVTSAGIADGKTTTVTALAAAFAETGQDVVVMDLDLRAASLTKMLNTTPQTSNGHLPPKRRRGKNGARKQQQPARSVPAPVAVAELPGVRLLPLNQHTMGGLDEMMERLPGLIDQTIEAGSVVILDTAPVSVVADTLRIAPMSETVVFVARPRRTSRRQLIRSRDLLLRTGASMAGLVLVGQAIAGKGRDDAYNRYHMRLNEDSPSQSLDKERRAAVAGARSVSRPAEK